MTTAETLKHKISPWVGETAPQAVDVLLYTPGEGCPSGLLFYRSSAKLGFGCEVTPKPEAADPWEAAQGRGLGG